MKIKLFIKKDNNVSFIKEANFSDIDEVLNVDFTSPSKESMKEFIDYGILGMQKVRVGENWYLAQISEIEKGLSTNESTD